MPGVNCSIVGCTVSRRSKYQGCGIYKVPSGEDEFETNWRNKFIAIITRGRPVDTDLIERINKKKLYICQRHFSSEDLNSYGVCCGITDKTLGYSFTEHSVPKQFSLTDATCKIFPLHQSNFLS